MTTISPAFDEMFAASSDAPSQSWLLSPAFWSGVAFLALCGGVAVWRMSICLHSVLACVR